MQTIENNRLCHRAQSTSPFCPLATPL